MSWTRSWYLEKRVDGVWHRDERPWHPAVSPLFHPLLIDRSERAEWFFNDVDVALSSLANQDLPHDLSLELDAKITKYVDHVADEFLCFPSFSWLLIRDILQADWSPVTSNDSSKRDFMERWLEYLAALGDPNELRLVSMLSG